MAAVSVHLRATGTSLLVALCEGPQGRRTPVVVHWGADLGALDGDAVAAIVAARTVPVRQSALDDVRRLGVLPESSSGFTGTPAVEGLRTPAGDTWDPRWSRWQLSGRHDGTTTGGDLQLLAVDPECGLEVVVDLQLTVEGVVRMRSAVRNTADGDFALGALRSVLPVGSVAVETLDLTGRWARERSPQRHPFHHGAWVRAGRHGRTGHDATLVMVAGSAGFSFRQGTVWGVHLGWSGDSVHYAERTAEGEAVLGAGELLGPGEVVLRTGEAYTSPWMHGSWSDRGLDSMSARFHALQRRVHSAHPASRTPRKVLVNTWEAVYFDHDLERLTALADAAAEVGAERFVLDDGWFLGRRDDTAGLGDWTVDPAVWPQGLHPLVDHVHGLGMDFGLWVEPEMVNVDSDLARAHPEWLLRGREDLPPEWRHQQVLDLQQEEAFAHVRDALLALLDEYDIAFLKWDHNRDIVDAAHLGRPAVHGQTLAVYALLDELREAHPGLEIETCASGGGRVDLGVLARTDRVWPSDTIDALERQQVQRWTALLLPPEVLGAHVGSPVAHTTGRVLPLDFRAATALLGHFGIEWDLTRAGAHERDRLARWVRLHQRLRPLVARGTLVRGDHPDPSLLVTGVVSPDHGEAVFVLAAVASSTTQTPLPVALPGLRHDVTYDVRRVGPGAEAADPDSWLATGLRLPGVVLDVVGVRVPAVLPDTAVVLHCTAAG
ncbi:MAG TPA: alpha-galactosidase [Nocardioidaceae bacterium]|nr:alpha-galactosidase [Nocardioidaceae bacterium]